jgi:hypothetical protein
MSGVKALAHSYGGGVPTAAARPSRATVQHYRDGIFDNLLQVVNFWMSHSIDSEHGGFLTCLDRKGDCYDHTKYAWMQGRQLFMMSRLCMSPLFQTEALAATRVRMLAALRTSAPFLQRAFVALPKNSGDPLRCYFSVARDGSGGVFQRKIFSECFLTMGFFAYAALERAEAPHAASCEDSAALDQLAQGFQRLAQRLLLDILRVIADPSLIGAHAKAPAGCPSRVGCGCWGCQAAPTLEYALRPLNMCVRP